MFYRKASAAGTGLHYVSRGDPAAHDFVLADFTKDGNWHNLDLSGIVPSTAKVVRFRCEMMANTLGRWMHFCQKGYTQNVNTEYLKNQSTTEGMPNVFQLPIDTDGIIQYKVSSANVTGIYFLVNGWWLL